MLSDPEAKKKYDQFGEEGLKGGPGGGGGFRFRDAGTIFEQFFGNFGGGGGGFTFTMGGDPFGGGGFRQGECVFLDLLVFARARETRVLQSCFRFLIDFCL